MKREFGYERFPTCMYSIPFLLPIVHEYNHVRINVHGCTKKNTSRNKTIFLLYSSTDKLVICFSTPIHDRFFQVDVACFGPLDLTRTCGTLSCGRGEAPHIVTHQLNFSSCHKNAIKREPCIILPYSLSIYQSKARFGDEFKHNTSDAACKK